jgi:Uncharacterised nucleotidyltransferase
MSQRQGGAWGPLILRALLDSPSCLAGLEDGEWGRVAEVAERNGVLLRLGDKLGAAGLTPVNGFTAAEGRERRRARAMLEVIGEVSRVCSAGGLAFIFPKAFQHFPDMGTDVDLLLPSPPSRAGSVLAAGLGVAPARRNFQNWVAGTITYEVGGSDIPLDVHYGRLGILGEEMLYPRAILENAKRVRIEGVEFLTPSAEDQLLLQGMQKVYGRRRLRLSDLLYAMTAVRQEDLDWDYLLQGAHRLGMFAGLSCYLSYAEQVNGEVCGGALLRPELRRAVLRGDWGRVEFRDGYYRFPTLAVAGQLYVRKFAAAVARGNWESAARLCLLPLLGLASALGRLRERLSWG